MAKRKFVLLVLMMALFPLSTIHVNAQNPKDIDLSVGYTDPENGEDPDYRSPILVPHVGIDGYTLYFFSPCDGCTLRLSDENNNVVYLTVIPTEATSLVLPAYLSGEYRIEIISGNFCFWGYIEL